MIKTPSVTKRIFLMRSRIKNILVVSEKRVLPIWVPPPLVNWLNVNPPQKKETYFCMFLSFVAVAETNASSWEDAVVASSQEFVSVEIVYVLGLDDHLKLLTTRSYTQNIENVPSFRFTVTIAHSLRRYRGCVDHD